MVRNLICVILITGLFSCEFKNTKNKPDVDTRATGFKDSTIVEIIDSVYDFGKIVQGDKVEYKFHFRNIGKNPLIITHAASTCGCTIPEVPDAPILPGQVGFLNVVFNSAGKMGTIVKDITVISNAYPKFSTLRLKGEVITKDQQ